MWSVIILNVWRGLPVLGGDPAGRADRGAAGGHRGGQDRRRGAAAPLHYVVVPIVRPILFVGLLYSIVFSFTDFSAVWLLTQGGPYNTTHVFGTYAYNIGINAGDIGHGRGHHAVHLPVPGPDRGPHAALPPEGVRRGRARALWRRLKRDYGPYLPLAPYLFVVLFPFYWMVITAFKRDNDLYNLTTAPVLVQGGARRSTTCSSCSRARCSSPG